MIKLGILGAGGRMGATIRALLDSEFSDDASVVAAVDRGQPMAPLFQADAVIDFSLPEGGVRMVKESEDHDGRLPAWIVGSTGWSMEGRKLIEAYSDRAPVLMSSNFSLGVAAMMAVLREATPLFDRLGFTPVIVERHHRHKKDAPSGTAASIQRVISPSGPGNVQVHSVRAGEVIGEHEVTFYGPSDEVSITHRALDRGTFARGAVQAALWIAGRRLRELELSGMVTMEEFLASWLKVRPS